jgi:hypothetical protein
MQSNILVAQNQTTRFFALFQCAKPNKCAIYGRGKIHNRDSPELCSVYQTLICAQNKLRCNSESAQISARLRQLREKRMAFICARAKQLCPKCVDLRS